VIDYRGLSATRLIDLQQMETAQADTVILLPFKQEDGTNAPDRSIPFPKRDLPGSCVDRPHAWVPVAHT